jgi:8-oxo-dGTP diphosphatase
VERSPGAAGEQREDRSVSGTHRVEGGDGEYPDLPVVAVGAVIIEGDRVLLIRRGREPGRGEWSIPGGRLELGERIAEAARREVREECGIEIDVGDLIGVTERIVRDEGGSIRFHYVLLDVNARSCAGRSAGLRASSDALEVCWVERDELRDYGLPLETRGIIERAFRMASE